MIWLKEHFEPATRTTSPNAFCLLFLDGHESHKSWDFLHYCDQHRIIVLCLPAHTTHKLQPLNIGCFQSLKTHYQHAVEQDCRYGYQAIEKFQFIELYQLVRPLVFDSRHVERA